MEQRREKITMISSPFSLSSKHTILEDDNAVCLGDNIIFFFPLDGLDDCGLDDEARTKRFSSFCNYN